MQSTSARTSAPPPPTRCGRDASAELGWATYGEDENVNELERRGAELLGKEAAVLVPTCSLANLATLLAQTEPGTACSSTPTLTSWSTKGSG
jgi:threonine aldolase